MPSLTVILLQIVMVSPGTHLVKNHEFLSRTIECQFKINYSLGFNGTTHLIWRQTPKLCTSFFCQAQERLTEIRLWVIKQQPRKSHKQDIYSTKTSYGLMLRLEVCVWWDTYHKLVWVFENFHGSGMQDIVVNECFHTLI